MTAILPFDIINNILEHSQQLDQSTFRTTFDYTGSRIVSLNPESTFVGKAIDSIKIISETLRQYDRLKYYLANAHNTLTMRRKLEELWQEYVDGKIDGKNVGLLVDHEDYDILKNIFFHQIHHLANNVSGLSQASGITVIEAAAKAVINSNPALTIYVEGFIHHYMNDCPELTQKFNEPPRRVIIFVPDKQSHAGRFTLFSVARCMRKLRIPYEQNNSGFYHVYYQSMDVHRYYAGITNQSWTPCPCKVCHLQWKLTHMQKHQKCKHSCCEHKNGYYEDEM
jgi:hypothetical protein